MEGSEDDLAGISSDVTEDILNKIQETFLSSSGDHRSDDSSDEENDEEGIYCNKTDDAKVELKNDDCQKLCSQAKSLGENDAKEIFTDISCSEINTNSSNISSHHTSNKTSCKDFEKNKTFSSSNDKTSGGCSKSSRKRRLGDLSNGSSGSKSSQASESSDSDDTSDSSSVTRWPPGSKSQGDRSRRSHGRGQLFKSDDEDSMDSQSQRSSSYENGSFESKRKKLTPFVPPTLKEPNRDIFCWKCHKYNENLQSCSNCPRVYHSKCSNLRYDPSVEWLCDECETVRCSLKEEVVRDVPLLKELLLYTLRRMRQYDNNGDFEDPVDTDIFPDYKKYIVNSMCLSLLEKNVKKMMYKSCQAFEADVKWMVHNSYIYNGPSSKLTTTSRSICRSAISECEEITVCPECYLHANTLTEWFVEPCSDPHMLVWAKLHGFPFWPGKVVQVVDNKLDVRFFGDHNKALLQFDLVYLYSPRMIRLKHSQPNLEIAIEEAEQYIKKLEKKFGKFVYAKERFALTRDNILDLKKFQLPLLINDMESNLLKRAGPTPPPSPPHSLSDNSKSPIHIHETEYLLESAPEMCDPERDPLADDLPSQAPRPAKGKANLITHLPIKQGKLLATTSLSDNISTAYTKVKILSNRSPLDKSPFNKINSLINNRVNPGEHIIFLGDNLPNVQMLKKVKSVFPSSSNKLSQPFKTQKQSSLKSLLTSETDDGSIAVKSKNRLVMNSYLKTEKPQLIPATAHSDVSHSSGKRAAVVSDPSGKVQYNTKPVLSKTVSYAALNLASVADRSLFNLLDKETEGIDPLSISVPSSSNNHKPGQLSPNDDSFTKSPRSLGNHINMGNKKILIDNSNQIKRSEKNPQRDPNSKLFEKGKGRITESTDLDQNEGQTFVNLDSLVCPPSVVMDTKPAIASKIFTHFMAEDSGTEDLVSHPSLTDLGGQVCSLAKTSNPVRSFTLGGSNNVKDFKIEDIVEEPNESGLQGTCLSDSASFRNEKHRHSTSELSDKHSGHSSGSSCNTDNNDDDTRPLFGKIRILSVEKIEEKFGKPMSRKSVSNKTIQSTDKKNASSVVIDIDSDDNEEGSKTSLEKSLINKNLDNRKPSNTDKSLKVIEVSSNDISNLKCISPEVPKSSAVQKPVPSLVCVAESPLEALNKLPQEDSSKPTKEPCGAVSSKILPKLVYSQEEKNLKTLASLKRRGISVARKSYQSPPDRHKSQSEPRHGRVSGALQDGGSQILKQPGGALKALLSEGQPIRTEGVTPIIQFVAGNFGCKPTSASSSDSKEVEKRLIKLMKSSVPSFKPLAKDFITFIRCLNDQDNTDAIKRTELDALIQRIVWLSNRYMRRYQMVKHMHHEAEKETEREEERVGRTFICQPMRIGDAEQPLRAGCTNHQPGGTWMGLDEEQSSGRTTKMRIGSGRQTLVCVGNYAPFGSLSSPCYTLAGTSTSASSSISPVYRF